MIEGGEGGKRGRARSAHALLRYLACVHTLAYNFTRKVTVV